MPYSQLKDVIDAWAARCTKLIVFEHPADDKVATTHIHAYLEGCEVKEQQLKRTFTKFFPNVTTGNELWAWTHKSWHQHNPGQPYNDGMITYMSKGIHHPVFSKGFSDEVVEERRQQWKAPVQTVEAPPVKESKEKYDEWDDLKETFLVLHRESELMSFDRVRSWTFHWYWKKYGRCPIASTYKRNAGSLWLLWNEVNRNGNLSAAMHDVMDKWY